MSQVLNLNGISICRRIENDSINLNHNQILDVASTADPSAAANKQYVDGQTPARMTTNGANQTGVNLSGFNKDLAWADVQSKLLKITTPQSSINLFAFKINPTWDDVQSKPLWVPRIFYVSVATNLTTLV